MQLDRLLFWFFWCKQQTPFVITKHHISINSSEQQQKKIIIFFFSFFFFFFFLLSCVIKCYSSTACRRYAKRKTTEDHFISRRDPGGETHNHMHLKLRLQKLWSKRAPCFEAVPLDRVMLCLFYAIYSTHGQKTTTRYLWAQDFVGLLLPSSSQRASAHSIRVTLAEFWKC